MVDYLERIKRASDNQMTSRDAARAGAKEKSQSDWQERLTPLEQRLRRLLDAMPQETLAAGITLESIRRLLAGKWRGNCHPGELGEALRKLNFKRRRSWSDNGDGFRARWFRQTSDHLNTFFK